MMLNIKYALGWINFLVMILLRLALIVVGFIIVPIPQVIAFKRNNPKLPRVLWLWDNDEDSFYGATWYVEKMIDEKGWGLLRISLVWNIVRNPANNLRYAGYGISPGDVKKVLVNSTSFDDTNINPVSTPVPALIKKLSNKTYIQKGLIRSGFFYYPIYRKINLNGDGTFTEIRIGFKYSPWWLEQIKLGKEMPIKWQTRTPTVQYAKRPISYWA